MNQPTKPHYLRDAEWEIARALASLWTWGAIIEQKHEPTETTLYVYLHQLAKGGPHDMKGKRVVVTLSLESEEPHAVPN